MCFVPMLNFRSRISVTTTFKNKLGTTYTLKCMKGTRLNMHSLMVFYLCTLV